MPDTPIVAPPVDSTKSLILEDFGRQRCYAVCRWYIRAPMHTPPDPLDPILDLWKDPPKPAPGLAPEVWRRILLDEGATRDGFWAEAAAWLSRPPFAAMFVASCALLGLFLAEVRVNRVQRERSSQLARSYLLLIDPLLRAGPEGKAP
jgi:hypothetical protein